jgi:3-deoxy-D-manno-octulosonic acid kinase
MSLLSATHLWFDPAMAPAVTENHFDPDWLQRQQLVTGAAKGRGTVYFFRVGPATWVLRRYLRGGWMGRFNRGAYAWFGLERSRPWREWRLLAELRAKGLPVPRPIAARVRRSGMVYGGDLITERIEPAAALAALMVAKALDQDDWRKIGALLARFHEHGVRHDDINVSNMLRDEQGRYHLIDFDNARIEPAGAWQERNLARFRRSIDKLRRRNPAAAFQDSDWAAVMAGYRGR